MPHKLNKRTTNHAFVIILVGGKGKRLRPLSTDERPKPFLSVTRNGRSLFQNTYDRVKAIVPSGNIIVASNKRHVHLIRNEAPSIKAGNIIAEPASRNTAPAIGLAAIAIMIKHGDAAIFVTPADNYVSDTKAYISSVRAALDFVKKNDALVCLGVKPSYPSTQFGYVRLSTLHSPLSTIKKVEEFTEKPSLARAKRFLRSGRYLWNAGGFVFRASTILKAIEKHKPEIFRILTTIDRSITRTSRALLKAPCYMYNKMPNISIDYAVMEKADNVYCSCGSYGWQDVGSFDSLKTILRQESRDFVELGDKVIKIL